MTTDPYEDREKAQAINMDDWKKLSAHPGRIEVHDPMLDVVGALSANIAALALAIDAYTQLRRKETTNNG